MPEIGFSGESLDVFRKIGAEISENRDKIVDNAEKLYYNSVNISAKTP